MPQSDDRGPGEGGTAPARRSRPEGRRSFLGLMAFFGVIFLAVIVLQMSRIYSERSGLVGDGRNVASYGYELEPFLGDRELLVASGRAKDTIPVLGELTVISPEDFEDAVPLPGAGPLDRPGPKAVTAEVVAMYEDKPFDKPVVGSDRVIGVTIDGEARAYPLRYMQGHEIVNDTLAGSPIAVTYSVLCDSVVVFDRRVAGETLEFGFSGLIYNSNLVMYDRRPDAEPGQVAGSDVAGSDVAGSDVAGSGKAAGSATGASADQAAGSKAAKARASSHGESLWSQLAFKAIAGPAAEAGQTLEPLPIWHGPFKQWRQMHPETTVFIGDPRHEDRYEQSHLMQRYFERGKIVFPVAAKPPTGGPRKKMTPIDAYRTEAGGWRVVRSDREDAADLPADRWRVHARWFAWYAFHEAGQASGSDRSSRSGESAAGAADAEGGSE